MSKQFKFGQDAMDSILKGAKIISKSVGSSLGPRGKLTLIKQQNGSRVTKDGVTIAKNCLPLKDNFEQMGAELIVEAAKKTVEQVGDGTTSCTILAERIISEGSKLVAAGHNPIDIKRGIEYGVERIVESLQQVAKPVKSQKEIEQVATVSSNNDVEIGRIISQAMEQVGNDGVITLSESHNSKTEIDMVTGYQFDRGYLSPHFATNEKLECILENPLVLIYDKSINNVNVILPVLQECHKKFPGRPLFISAESVDGEAIATLLVNHIKRSFMSCATRNPGYGDRRKEMLNDMAVLTGGKVIDEDLGFKLENFDITWLGQAKKIIITKGSTTIVDGAGKEEDIKVRIEEVRNSIKNCAEEYDKEKQEERLAKLIGGVANIMIGGVTESEVQEKKDRFEDSLSATRSAVEEGIVVGGGVALLRAAMILDTLDIPEDLQIGAKIVRRAVEEPLRKIVENCGGDPTMVRLKIMENPSNTFGFNARTEKFEDLVESGIIDPAKVVRCALQNAASVAGLILTTECMIADEPEEKKNEPNGMM
ncbi:MAG: chaperonin GroEL [Patescibacteria group bacterium]